MEQVMDISSWIAHRAVWSPNKVAIRFEEQQITYAQFEEKVARLAGGLCDLGVTQGERVAYLGYNSPELLELLFACARLGAIFAPLNARMTVEEHRFFLENCQPCCIVVESNLHQHSESCLEGFKGIRKVLFGQSASENLGELELHVLIDNANPLSCNSTLPPSTPVLIAYTSGTTGQPKGVVLTQEALFYNALNSISTFDITSRDEVLTIIPMFHVGGMNIHTTPAIHAGATVTILRQFEPADTLREIERWQITLLVAHTPVARAITAHPNWESTSVRSLRCFVTGASIVPDDVIRPWFERGVPATQVYGLTESCPIAIVVPLFEAERKAGAAGKPVLYCNARIVDMEGNNIEIGEQGEILLRGPNLLKEYWMNPDATEEAFIDGWFRTGDIGHVDDEGYFYIDDRIKNVIIVGPSNVYPADLERVLMECEVIKETAVVGQPDPEMGEVPVACVVLKEGYSMSADDVKGLFEGRLAAYKHPRRVVFMESLPRTGFGKVEVSELKQRVKNA